MCDLWHHRWNSTRASAISNTTYKLYIEFVHVPKAAGHTIENALNFAFHGNFTGNRKSCSIATSDCEYYHGGHLSIVHRPRGRSYITILRAPM